MFRNVVEHIRNRKLNEAKAILFQKIQEEVEVVLEDRKRWLQAETILSDEEKQVLDEARFHIVRLRIRRGKIQRRKKVSNIKGYTFRGGRMIKMSPRERRNRRISQRRGKIKRRSKMTRSLQKRKRSMRRLNAFGGRR